MLHGQAFDFQSLRQAYSDGVSPETVVEEVYRRIEALDDPGIFLALRDKEQVLADAKALGPSSTANGRLWGLPFAIKDNIDTGGMPTTAGCPAFAYMADQDAFVVARLRAAGALLIGKTNLDQFATGLVGTRTPHTVPKNALDPEIVPGGSSSGSAVAVANGLVSFALGTDTAGSGRVPAALNGIVGLKPSLGALSNTGVVPACRTLDAISIFALTVEDAHRVFQASIARDPDDAFSRSYPVPNWQPAPRHFNVGVPDAASRKFFGDTFQAQSFEESLQTLETMGAEIEELDFSPFYAVAELLYEGPWVAERHTVIEDLLNSRPVEIHPVTRQVTEVALKFSATDAFRAAYRLRDLAAETVQTIDRLDMLCVPSIPRFVTRAEIAADPIAPNAQLGTYTNFVNLLDLCAVTLPMDPREDGRPGSITFIGKAGADSRLAATAAAVQQMVKPSLGATPWPLPTADDGNGMPGTDEIALVAVGAHMSGLPLNGELTRLGGRFLRAAKTQESYRLYKLAGGPPMRPGLIRDTSGSAIEVEIWALPVTAVGTFLAGIPSPLGLGTVALDDGTSAHGFLCEAIATEDAEDITDFGGWRAFLNSLSLAPQPDKELHHATA